MISKRLLWFIGIALLGVLAVSRWGKSYPAHVVVMNQAGTIRNVTLSAAGQVIELGELRRGDSRAVKIPSGDYLSLRFRSSEEHSWRSIEKITPAQSLILTISPEERVGVRAGFGAGGGR